VRSRLSATALVFAAAAVLVLVPPRFAERCRQLGHARQWFADAGPDAALAELAGTCLWLVAAWLCLGVAATVLGRLPGVLGRVFATASRRMLPAALRRLVAGSVGVGVLLAPASAALASTAVGPAVAATVLGRPGAGHGLPPPGWPVDGRSSGSPARPRTVARPTAPASTTPVPPGPRPAGAAAVRVRPGDSLWVIAARRLGPSAGPEQIAAAWPRWYHGNRETIGADPDLIMPGQVLKAPAAEPDWPRR
jgi:hypothetical protein